jgi:hypothetical protein
MGGNRRSKLVSAAALIEPGSYCSDAATIPDLKYGIRPAIGLEFK